MQPLFNMPESISEIVTGYLWSQVAIGQSSAKVFCLQQPSHLTYYLKIAHKLPRRDLMEECRVLNWLSDKLPVPEVICFDEDDDRDYLLVSEIPGVDVASLTGDTHKVDLVKLLARGLRTIHEIPIESCPFNRTLDVDMKIAEFNVKYSLLEDGDFDDFRQGIPAKALYDELVNRRPESEDLVFTHGDYCLPNIIILGIDISGFVDLHRAGIADRYKDIASAIRSINSNLGSGLESYFFNEYGIPNPENEKIEYYILLDEFF
ncbi:APH(3') family aminoglycoside O-phosphotransferase [Chloroflexota bacterium]